MAFKIPGMLSGKLGRVPGVYVVQKYTVQWFFALCFPYHLVRSHVRKAYYLATCLSDYYLECLRCRTSALKWSKGNWPVGGCQGSDGDGCLDSLIGLSSRSSSNFKRTTAITASYGTVRCVSSGGRVLFLFSSAYLQLNIRRHRSRHLMGIPRLPV